MREQADAIAHHLVLRADGDWELDLPPSLRDLYSKAYGRYAYSIVDGTGHVLFSSLDESRLQHSQVVMLRVDSLDPFDR